MESFQKVSGMTGSFSWKGRQNLRQQAPGSGQMEHNQLLFSIFASAAGTLVLLPQQIEVLPVLGNMLTLLQPQSVPHPVNAQAADDRGALANEEPIPLVLFRLNNLDIAEMAAAIEGGSYHVKQLTSWCWLFYQLWLFYRCFPHALPPAMK